MELLLHRSVKTDTSTIGKLSVNGKFLCLTLEDKDRDLVQNMPAAQILKIKVHGKTAIPRGRYRVILSFSSRFQKILPEILDVPGYAGIRCHPGNSAVDTDGCVLTGNTQSANWVGESKKAFEALMELMEPAAKTEKIYITIE